MSSSLLSEPTHPLDGANPQPPSQDRSITGPERPRDRGTHRRPHRGRYQPRNPNYRLSRTDLREFAALTLKKLEDGTYIPPHTEDPYDLAAKIDYTNENTAYYAPDDPDLENWGETDLGVTLESDSENKTKLVIREYSTLVGARRLHGLVGSLPETGNKIVGVLNFASAKKAGGGFINGAQAQEESIARASTLYPSLVTPIGMQFYSHYAAKPDDAYYTHAMTYSPSVVLFRNDIGHWMKPIEVDVLTSAAVNAGEVREQVRREEEMRLLRERVKEAEEKRKRQRERRRQMEADWRKLDEEESQQTKGTTQEEENETGKDGQEPEEVTNDTAGATVAEEKEPEKGNDSEAVSVETQATVELTTINDPGDGKSLETSTNTQGNEAIQPPIDGAAETQETPVQPTSSEPETGPEPLEAAPDPFYLTEIQIDVQMYERIGRLLYLFHKRGVKHLVLGSFGTGVFQNRVELVAGIFYDLLAKPDARFKNSFETVVFAILGGWTVKVFREVFGDAALDRIEGEDDVDEEGSEVEGMRDAEGGLDGELQGKAEAEEKPMDFQMEGKAEEEEEKPLEEQIQEAEGKPVDIQMEGKAPSDESNDVEMIDLTQEPTVESKPDNIEPATTPIAHDPPTVDEPEVQSQT